MGRQLQDPLHQPRQQWGRSRVSTHWKRPLVYSPRHFP